MAERSAIEWTDATFNPWMGCTKVSPGCDGCYAEARMDTRLHVVQWGAGQPRKRTSTANWRDPVKWNGLTFVQCKRCGWRGELAAAGKTGECPGCGWVDHYRVARRRVFCASLADVFDNEVDAEWRRDLFRLIAATKNLDWLLLTKRIGNAAKMLQDTVGSFGFDWAAAPWDHVWLGATVVNQEEADRDIPKLLSTPAAVRFLSMEPLLGPVDVTPFLWGKHEAVDTICQNCPRDADCECGYHTRAAMKLSALHWMIVGGESGHHARPMHPDWARSLRDQCAAAGVPFLFKQWGEWKPICQGGGDWYDSLYVPRVKAREHENQDALNDSYGRRCTVPQIILRIAGDHAEIAQPLAFEVGSKAVQAFKVGKKAAGRQLDGHTHDGFPIGLEGCK